MVTGLTAQRPLYRSLAYPEERRQLADFPAAVEKPFYLLVAPVFQPALPSPGLIVKALGERAGQAGRRIFTAFITVAAKFGGQVQGVPSACFLFQFRVISANLTRGKIHNAPLKHLTGR